jgi:Family of unknown function (DUF6173)
MNESMRLEKERTFGFANVIYKRLAAEVTEFQNGLDENHELGALMASFGRTVEIRVLQMTFRDPYLLIFTGLTVPANQPVRLIQHTTQMNLLLIAVPRLDPTKPPRRIGFGG